MAFEDRSSPNTANQPDSVKSQNPVESSNIESCRSPSSSSINQQRSPQLKFFHVSQIDRKSPLFCPMETRSEDATGLSSCSDNEQYITKAKCLKFSPNSAFESYKLGRNINSMFSNESCFSIANVKPDPDEISSNSDSNSNNTAPPIRFSIQNILEPDFGKEALTKTKESIVRTKVLYRPYENITQTSNKSVCSSPDTNHHSRDSNQSSEDTNRAISPDKFKIESGLIKSDILPPLGGLCQTISQIGQNDIKKVSKKECNNEKAVDSSNGNSSTLNIDPNTPALWPAWIFCTRYSDRPSSGPRSRRMKKTSTSDTEEKRPRTAFSGAQLARLKNEFTENRYLTERRRQQLSAELGLNEAQIKIWFQNKRAKIKKSSGQRNPLALQLMAQGLYNHTTVPLTEEEQELQARAAANAAAAAVGGISQSSMAPAS